MVCSVRTDNGWQLFDMIWRCCNAVGDFFANSRCECSASPRAVYRTAVPDSDTWAWNCKLAHPEMKIVLPCELHMCVASEILAGKKTEDSVAFAWRWSQNSTRLDEFMIALRRAISQQIWLTQRSAEPCDVRREFTKVFGNQKQK